MADPHALPTLHEGLHNRPYGGKGPINNREYKLGMLILPNNIIKVAMEARMRVFVVMFACLLSGCLAQNVYNHNSISYRNQTWMSLF